MVSCDGSIQQSCAPEDRFAVGKCDVLCALVLLTIIEVLRKPRTCNGHAKDVCARDRRLKSLCVTIEDAVSLCRAYTGKRKQTIEWRGPESDVGLLHGISVLHQELIAAIDQIACPELHCKLNTPRDRIDELKGMVVGAVGEFQVRLGRHSPEAVAVLTCASKSLAEFPYRIGESSLEAWVPCGFGNLRPVIDILAVEQSQVREFIPTFSSLHLWSEEAIPGAGAGMAFMELQWRQ